MAKKSSIYECDNCGNTSPFYFGVCPKCKEGIGVEKEDISKETALSKVVQKGSNKSNAINSIKYIKDEKKKTLSEYKEEDGNRFKTSYTELNKLFGGDKKNGYGLTEGSLTALSGKPGVGKSTLLLKLQTDMEENGLKTAYISAEESVLQIKNRAKRLGIKSDDLVVENQNNLGQIIIDYEDYDFLIIDSITMMYLEGATGDAGGISQLKACTIALMNYAKQHKKTIIMIVQVNKDDKMAGPKSLEHMVDTVIDFDFYDSQELYRYLKSGKNRFGISGEIAIMEMKTEGLKEILNPSLLFIDKNKKKIGASTSIILDGNKPIFVETQALIVDANTEKTITQSIGYDSKRINQLSAILSKHLSISSYMKNIFVATTGGLNIKNTHTDLSIAAAILSSIKDISVNDYVFIGEIGLTGEIIKAPNEENLIKQSKKYGFDKIICNSEGYEHIKDIKKIFQKEQ